MLCVKMNKPKFDQKAATSFLGKHLLVGVTYLDDQEKFLEQKQFHGTIVRVNEHEGIVVSLNNSREEFKLPPDLGSLKEAEPGEYKLRSTGEVVVDPDLITSWTSTKPSTNE